MELKYCAHGKPSLAGRFADSGLQFNMSHCDDVAVVGLSRGCAIGVDIERVRAIPDADAIVACYFSRRENEAYSILRPCDKLEGFFNCWTRKEAFIKAVGDGLSYPLHRFDVSLAPGEPARILRIMDAPGDAAGWRLHNFEPGPGLAGAFVLQTLDDKFASRI